MSPAGPRMQLHKGIPPKILRSAIKSHCFARVTALRADNHLLPNSRVRGHEGPYEVGIQLRYPAHDRPVLFANLTLFKLRGQFLMNLIVFRNQNHSGCVAVQAMHNPGTMPPRHVTQLVEMKLQGCRQSASGTSTARMHHHARGFVHDNQRIVFVNNAERQVFRFNPRSFRIGQRDTQPIIYPQASGNAGNQSIQSHPATLNNSLQLRTTVVREQSTEIMIQSPAVRT